LVEVDDDSQEPKTIDWIERSILSLKNPCRSLQKVHKKLGPAMDAIPSPSGQTGEYADRIT